MSTVKALESTEPQYSPYEVEISYDVREELPGATGLEPGCRVTITATQQGTSPEVALARVLNMSSIWQVAIEDADDENDPEQGWAWWELAELRAKPYHRSDGETDLGF